MVPSDLVTLVQANLSLLISNDAIMNLKKWQPFSIKVFTADLPKIKVVLQSKEASVMVIGSLT